MPNAAGSPRIDSASRSIRATPQAIFRAFLDPEAVAAWLPPEGMTGEIFAFEPREGGAFRMALTYLSEAHASAAKSTENADIVEGRFLRLVPDREIAQAFVFVSDDPAFGGEMTMTWTLTPMSGGTEVKVVAENVPVGIRQEDHEAAMRSTLDNLARYVE